MLRKAALGDLVAARLVLSRLAVDGLSFHLLSEDQRRSEGPNWWSTLSG